MSKMKSCAWCGRLFRPLRASHIYCGEACQGAANYSPKTLIPEEVSCPYNEHLICGERKCDHCGWNPEVAKARLAAILAKMKEDKP